MEGSTQSPQQTVSMWITSLAVSVTCCAVLFVIFAGYLNDIKNNLRAANVQLEQMSARDEQLLMEIKSLQKVVNPPAAPAASTTETPVAPAATTPAAPAASAPAAPVGSAAPAVPPAAKEPAAKETVTPPTTAPNAIPEVPAKQ